ncbi:MAG: hypothetical protein JWQ83_1736 [Lacunisphaera sp.]|nr:hypothetical protein [Lacunisphaera sp.]MDB6166596.1 hypothetical protein [Lacunisphaera sp.]
MSGGFADGYVRAAMKELRSLLKIALGLLALVLLVAPLTSTAQEPVPEKKLTKAKEKYDVDKDGKLSDAEKAAAKEEAAAKARETHEANLAKYDTNKDGKLDDAEKAAKKADEDALKEAKKAEKEARKAEKK